MLCWHFNIYEQDNFRTHWDEHEKSFLTLGPDSFLIHIELDNWKCVACVDALSPSQQFFSRVRTISRLNQY